MDEDRRKGRMIVYKKSSLQSKLLTNFKLTNDFQKIPFKVKLRTEK